MRLSLLSIPLVITAAFVAGNAGSPVSAPAAMVEHARAIAPTKHCGFFKYGTDGKQPGPSGITANNVSCWFARAVALLGPPPGWHCTNPVGLLFVCKRGDAVVRFYGE